MKPCLLNTNALINSVNCLSTFTLIHTQVLVTFKLFINAISFYFILQTNGKNPQQQQQ